jgi:hypothetical protein
MKLYCAGQMRGLPQFGFPKFDAACARLRDAGHVAIGPQDLDRLCGLDEKQAFQSDVTAEQIRKYMRRDTLMITDEAEGLVVLDGWEKSAGALAEVALARCIGLPVFNERLCRVKIHIEIKTEVWSGE